MNKLIYAGTITTGGDFNTAQTSGVYRYNGMPSNRPGTKENDYGIFYVMVTDSYVVQHAYSYLEQCWKHRATVINTYAWSDWKSEALKSDLPTLERISCKYFDETSLRGEISKDVVNALFVAPIVYNSIGAKVKQVYRTGKTIILLGESFVNTDSLDISVICY